MDEITLREDFGEEADQLFQYALGRQKAAIEFLQTPSKVYGYLQTEEPREKFGNIVNLRTEIPWFDQALKIIEGVDSLFPCDEQVNKKAIHYLNYYYRPVPPRENVKSNVFWEWILSQGNAILNAFVENWPRGVAHADFCVLARGADSYSSGTSYQKIEFSIPVPTDEKAMKKTLTLIAAFSFYWTEENICGKVRLSVDQDENPFDRKQQGEFLSHIYVDLANVQEKWEQKNIRIDKYGDFFISRDPESIAIIKKYLNERSLVCSLKLTS